MSYKSELKAVEMAALQLQTKTRRSVNLNTFEGWSNYTSKIMRCSSLLSYRELSIAIHYIGCVGKWSYNERFRQSIKAVKQYLRLVRDDRFEPVPHVVDWVKLKALGYTRL